MFKNPFRKSYKPSEHSMQVVIIDDDNENIGPKLGITEERWSVVAKHLSDYINDNRSDLDMAETMVALSSICKHPNELMYVGFVLGTFVEKHRSPLSLLSQLMKP